MPRLSDHDRKVDRSLLTPQQNLSLLSESMVRPTPKPTRKILPSYSGPRTVGYSIWEATNAVVFTLCVRSALAFKNSTQALAFYGVYHQEPTNQVIHFFGVPFILWTLLIGAAHLPLKFCLLDIPLIPRHHASWATLWAILYTAFYFKIDWIGACLYTPILFSMYGSSVVLTSRAVQPTSSWTGSGRLLRIAFVLHVLSWYLQIHLGHKILEGASPASVKSLGGALTTAPLFAFYEGVWYCGFHRAFRDQVLELVQMYTRDLCAQGANMRVCGSFE